MPSSNTTPEKKQDLEPSFFSLDAYKPPSFHSTDEREHTRIDQVTQNVSTQRSWSSPFYLIIQLWMTYAFIVELLRLGCHSGIIAFATTQSIPVCRTVPPSSAQFWNYVFSGQGHDIGSQSAAQQVDYLRQLLGLTQPRDLALRGLGALILQDFTSPTYRSPPTHPKGKHHEPPILNPPSTILEEQVLIGDCWEFDGSNGRVGISLAERVNITGFTIHYPQFHLLPPHTQMKAPRDITLWALVDPALFGDEFLSLTQEAKRPHELAVSKTRSTHLLPDHIFIPVSRASYDAKRLNSVQTFGRQASSVGLRLISQEFVVEVTNNWGSQTTCLYHIAIHGITPDFH